MHVALTLQDLRCNFREYISELSEDSGSCVIDEMNYLLDTYCSEWMRVYLGVKQYQSIKDNYCLYNKAHNKPLIAESCIGSIVYKQVPSFLDKVF
jgi:hypothetical protein